MSIRCFVVVQAPCLFALCLAAGCAKPGRQVVTLEGTVSYTGKPVVGGAIYFHSPDNQVAMGVIHDDGTFIATEVPVGDVRVSFQFKDAGGKDGPKDGGMYGAVPKVKGVASLPERFSDPDKSNLKYTIAADTRKLKVKID